MIPLPIIIVGLVLGAWKCASSTSTPSNQNNTRDAGNTEGTDAQSLPPDAGTNTTYPPDAGNQTTDAGTVCRMPQTPPPAIKKSEIPCAFPASLSYQPSTDSFITACTFPNALFRSGQRRNLSGAWQKIADIDGIPAHHLELPNDFVSVSHSSPDGISVVNSRTGTVASHIILSALVFQNQSQPGFALTFPSGMAYASGRLCVATSNTNSFGATPEDTTFNPGAMVCLNLNSAAGTIDGGSATIHMTSGINPTGATRMEDGRIAVLCSNDYKADRPLSAIDLFTPPEMTRVSLNLGSKTAQISPALAKTPGEEIIFGLQKPSNGIQLTDLTGTSGWTNNLNGAVRGFISNVSAVGNVIAISDFGVFGSGGRILFLNLTDPVSAHLITEIHEGQPGPATDTGNKLYLAATKTDASGASLYEVDLTNYECEK